MGRRIILLVNHDKPLVREVLADVRALVKAHGTIVDERDTGAEIPVHAGDADLLVVLGGDGTLIGQARRCAGAEIPIVGVNLGHLGFLAEFDLDAFREHTPTIIGGGALEVQDRLMLNVTVTREGNTLFHERCLNDCVVTAGPPFRMIEVGISINGQNGPTLKGDGVIVSSPTGSTAYSVSAGGPIVSPGLEAIAITPIAAHSLAFRPIVMKSISVVELDILHANPAEAVGAGTTLVLDGQVMHPLQGGERITVRRSECSLKLVRNPDSSYWETLVRKLHWAVQPSRMKPEEPCEPSAG